MEHIRQSTMGQGKTRIGLNSLGKLFLGTEILFQKQIEAFDEALGRHVRTGGERQSITVLHLGMVWHLWTPFIGHGSLQAYTTPYVFHCRLSVSQVISSCRAA